jgi:hypothetical protein
LKALKFTMPIVKIIIYSTSRLNLLEDLDTNSLYILILILTLIYPTFNLNLSLTPIYP